jgi:hypothetical protein
VFQHPACVYFSVSDEAAGRMPTADTSSVPAAANS